MKQYAIIDGTLVLLPEPTAEEIADAQARQEAAERDYWLTIDYGEAINQKIRERYSDSQEFAILRQKDEKPEEYAEYYAYCEECKAYVKAKKEEYSTTVEVPADV